MKKSSRKKYLLKNTIIFSIGNFGTKLISFFLVPLYTNILTTSEYGTVDLMTVLCSVVVPIITLNTSEAVMRFCMDKDADTSKILSIGIVMTFITAILSCILFPIFYSYKLVSDYALLLALFVFTTATATIFQYYVRGIEKLLDYAIISIIHTFSIAVLNIFFLVFLHLGIKGYILAYIIANTITIILCIIRGEVFSTVKNLSVDKKLLKSMLKYSVLLIPNSLMWWIINFLDRIMITSMIGISANGVYSVSYKIPSILTTLTTIFNQAWMFSAVREKDSDDKSEYTDSIFDALFTSVILVAAFLIIIIKPLLSIYVGKSFYDAWLYVPPLLIGTVFITIGTFLSNEYTAHKDSRGFLCSSTVGAITNFVFNLIFIKAFGVLGAALATCLSYIAVFTFRVFDTRKYVKINFVVPRRIISVILLIMISIISYVNSEFRYFILIILFVLLLFNNKAFLNTIIKNSMLIFKTKILRKS